MRTFNKQVELNATHTSSCPADVGGWALRVPLSSIWTQGHKAKIECKTADVIDESKYDELLLEFAINEAKYKTVADRCCRQLIVSGSDEVDGIYTKIDSVINGRVSYQHQLGDRVIFHDLENYAIGEEGRASYHVRSHLLSTDYPCPNMVDEWLSATDTGWIENRYITTECFYPKLMTQKGFQLRMGLPTQKLAMVRFFNSEQPSLESNEDFEAFMDIFPDLAHYSGQMTVNQINCDTNPGFGCSGGRLPKICTFKKNYTLTTLNPEKENMEQFLDRSLLARDPLSPPQECCELLRVEVPGNGTYNGTYAKTAQIHLGYVLYKQTSGSYGLNEANYVYYHSEQLCIGPDATQPCQFTQILAKRLDEELICPTMISQFEKDDLIMRCTPPLPGLTSSSVFKDMIKDALKIFVVRFFDDNPASHRTHKSWNVINTRLEKKQKYKSVLFNQIDCNVTSNVDYCHDMKIIAKPEILVIKEQWLEHRNHNFVSNYTRYT